MGVGVEWCGVVWVWEAGDHNHTLDIPPKYTPPCTPLSFSLHIQVTTLINDYDRALRDGVPSEEDMKALEAAVSAQGGVVKELKEAAKEDAGKKDEVWVSMGVGGCTM